MSNPTTGGLPKDITWLDRKDGQGPKGLDGQPCVRCGRTRYLVIAGVATCRRLRPGRGAVC